MAVFRLDDTCQFPSPELADESGLLAVGGDLSPKRLFNAYLNGIFPWFNPDDPLMWWSPNPRCVLFPNSVYVSKSMKKILRDRTFTVSTNVCFNEVIKNCKTIDRKGELGTWITTEMQNAYNELHNIGLAHSVEVWENDELIGGLYGIAIGKCFFGESMFSKKSNASKYGFIHLAKSLFSAGFKVIDCQVTNDHLLSLGAEEIPRNEFMNLLSNSLNLNDFSKDWRIAEKIINTNE